MKALDRLLKYVELCRGVSQSTWDSYNLQQKQKYLNDNPTSKYKPKVRKWLARVIPRLFLSSLLKSKQTQPDIYKWCIDDTHTLKDYREDKLCDKRIIHLSYYS